VNSDAKPRNLGAVVSVRGSVLDVRFGERLRSIYSVLRAGESLASENASRLSATQRADKNIDDLLEELNGSFRRLRQSSIDAELFDVIADVETLSEGSAPKTTNTRRGGTS